MVAAEIGIALGGSPGDRGRGDKRAGVGLVFVGEDDVVADVGEPAAIGGRGGDELGRIDAQPLLDEALAVRSIGSGEGLHHAGESGMMAVAEADGDGELAAMSDVDLSHDGDVAVERLAELPVHGHVGGEVLKAVAGADVAAGGAGESATDAHGEREVALPGEQAALAGDLDGAAGVARAAAVEMRREQGVALEAGEDRSRRR